MRSTWLAIALALVMAAPAGAATRLVGYDVSGGIAGLSERLVVDSDGSAQQPGDTTRRFPVATTQLHKLKRELEAARFGSLKRRYAPEVPVADGTTQSVRTRASRSPSPPGPTSPRAWSASCGDWST